MSAALGLDPLNRAKGKGGLKPQAWKEVDPWGGEEPIARIDRCRRYSRVETSGMGLGPIKGMIRHRETGQYYKGEGQWTPDAGQAMKFENLSNVVSEAQKFGLENCSEFVVEVGGKIGFRVLLPL
jgi:hypothetical protein